MTVNSKEQLQELLDITAGLSVLRFFPQDERAVMTIAKDIANMAQSIERARWLVKRMRELFDEWPGPVTMRTTYTDRYAAADEKTSTYSQACLPAGVTWEDKEATRGPWPQELLMEPKVPVRRAAQERPLLIPGKDFKPITADDIEKVRQTLRGEQQ